MPATDDKRNQNLMKAIKVVHSMIESDDINKHRQSQASIGALFGTDKDLNYQTFTISDIPAERVSVNRKHMQKYSILYLHGGGYFTGCLKYARILTTKLAASTSMDVYSFDYRLAPEHPFPAALEDALAVWDYLMYQGFGSRDIILAGDSAGGNLALALTLKLKEQGRLLPRGIVLMSPWTDLTLSGKTYESKKDLDPVLDLDYLTLAVKHYAQGLDLTDPFISPLFGDFTGFPPVYIQVGSNEVLLDDSLRLHKKMIRDRVLCKFHMYRGLWHVFQMSPFKTAYDAMDCIAEFIFDICR